MCSSDLFGGFDEAEEEERDGHEVHAARRELRQVLREKRGAGEDERRRVAAILREAAAHIRAKS